MDEKEKNEWMVIAAHTFIVMMTLDKVIEQVLPDEDLHVGAVLGGLFQIYGIALMKLGITPEEYTDVFRHKLRLAGLKHSLTEGRKVEDFVKEILESAVKDKDNDEDEEYRNVIL